MKVFSLIVTLVTSTAAVAELQAQQVEPRILRPAAGHRLVDLIRAGDPPTVVIDPASPPLYVLPAPGTSMLEWLTQLADVILIVDVLERKSRLTDGGEWVVSEVTAVVAQVFKAPAGGVTTGQRLSFLQRGGEAVVNSTQVSAITPGARAITAGRRYLAFAAKDRRTGEVLIGPSSTFELVKDRFVAVQDIPGEDGSLDKISASEVIATIGQYVGRGR